MDVLAIIPARGGSKGIPLKNLARLAGRPLVDWTLDAANESQLIDLGVLSSEMTDIYQRAWGKVQPLIRPAELAEDETSTEAVIAHAIDAVPGDYDAFVLLQPTSPLVRGDNIDEAIVLLEETGADSVVSVVPTHSLLWEDGKPQYDPTSRPRRQEMGARYEENGAIYVFTREHWQRTGCRLGGHVELYVMAEAHRLQIDSTADLEIASMLMANRSLALV